MGNNNNNLTPKITFIPAKKKQNKKVAIYCRVSTNHFSQEESLEAQMKGLKQIVNNNSDWILFKIYTDKDSGGNTCLLKYKLFESWEVNF